MDAQKALGIELDVAGVIAGINDSYAGRDLKLSDDAIAGALDSLNAQYARASAQQRDRQQEAGEAWRNAFMKKKGVLREGMVLYRVTDKGAGRRLQPGDTVDLTVTGTLPDGTVFDNSGDDGQTRTVRVGDLLPAVSAGLRKVSPGGKLTIVIPPEKGYGDAGLPPSIPGGATLIFEIEVKGLRANQ
jgi:FKBP-type peptidyl-prolyl cis-trans isomerase